MKSLNPIALDQTTNVIPIHFGKATIPNHLKNVLTQGDRGAVRLVFELNFPCEDAIILESTRAEIFVLLPNGDELKKDLPIFQNQNNVYATWCIDADFTKYAGTLSAQLNIYMGDTIFKQIKMDDLDIDKPLSSEDFIVNAYPNVLKNLIEDLKNTQQNLSENYYTKQQIDDFNFGSGDGSGGAGKDGKSAYQIWLSLGNVGSEQDFISSLIGADGLTGENGKSAYQTWLELGNIGSEEDFISSLIGVDGLTGKNGKSAYETWLELGNIGSEEDFISSLIGVDGLTGKNGKSAYETWLELGNIGTQQDFINSLKCTEENTFNPDLFYTKQETHQQIKVVENKISNPNLLINGGFSVWQRGTNFIAPNNQYTSDRWRCNGSGTVCSAPHTGMIITGLINLKYVMEEIDYATLIGKYCTLSYSKDGTVFQNTAVVNSPVVINLDVSNCTLNWVKLEVGEIASPFIPNNYAQELAICQRYYNKNNITAPVMNSYSNSKGTYDWMITVNKTYPTTMRILPTITPLYDFTISGIGADIKPSTYARCYQSLEGMNYFVIEQTNQPVAHNYVDAFIFEADAEIYN